MSILEEALLKKRTEYVDNRKVMTQNNCFSLSDLIQETAYKTVEKKWNEEMYVFLESYSKSLGEIARSLVDLHMIFTTLSNPIAASSTHTEHPQPLDQAGSRTPLSQGNETHQPHLTPNQKRLVPIHPELLVVLFSIVL